MTGRHWHASSLAGLLLTGRYRPLCAAIYAAPDCAARRAAMRALDRAFQEENHCQRVAIDYSAGKFLNEWGP